MMGNLNICLYTKVYIVLSNAVLCKIVKCYYEQTLVNYLQLRHTYRNNGIDYNHDLNRVRVKIPSVQLSNLIIMYVYVHIHG